MAAVSIKLSLACHLAHRFSPVSLVPLMYLVVLVQCIAYNCSLHLVSNVTDICFFPFYLKQHLDANILIPIVNVNEHALDKDSNNIDSNSIMMREEGKQHYETSENSRSSELLLELHEKRSDDPAKNEVEKALLLYVFSLKKHSGSIFAFNYKIPPCFHFIFCFQSFC